MEMVHKEINGLKLPLLENSSKLSPSTLLLLKSKELLEGNQSSASKKRKSGN